MKMVLLAIAVWSLTTAVGYGQGSAADRQAARDYQRRLVPNVETNGNDAIKTGRDLFGADDRWAGGKLNGTLRGKRGAVVNSVQGAETKEFKIGDWGCTAVRFRVIDKLSKSECLVQEVFPIIRGQSDPPIMLIRGFDMSKVTDGVEFVLQHPVWIDSTYDYTTVSGGQKTVLVLEPNAEKLTQVQAKLDAEAEAKRQAAIERAKAKEEREKTIEAAKWKTWTDASGEHKIEAKFNGLLSGTVKLTKRDGSTVKVPLEKLSDEDKAWIENRSKSGK